MSKNHEKKHKIDAVKALDEQIVMSRNYAAKVLQASGVESAAYAQAMDNLKTLTEARAAVADSMPKKLRINPTVWVSGAFGLASTGLLLLHDDQHVVPKWFHNGLDRLSDMMKDKNG